MKDENEDDGGVLMGNAAGYMTLGDQRLAVEEVQKSFDCRRQGHGVYVVTASIVKPELALYFAHGVE